MTSLPTTGIALQITERKQKTPLTLARVELPTLGATELLIENVVVAQAVGDISSVDYDFLIPSLPHTNGWDCSGVVVGVGKDVKHFETGDRVACFALSLSARQGSYQQYTVGQEAVTAKIPSSLSHEDAATLSLAWATALAGLHMLSIPPGGVDASLPLPAQPTSVAPVLIWGAASSVGAMGVQIAKLSGYRVIATASSSSFGYVKSLGADWVVDYNDGEKVVKEIQDLAEGKLSIVYDAISTPTSLSLGIKAIGPQGGKVTVVKPQVDLTEKYGRNDIEMLYGGAYDLLGKPELHNSFRLLESLLAKNKIVPHPYKVVPRGLLGVDEGWNLQRAGKIRAQKLVYRIAETPGISES